MKRHREKCEKALLKQTKQNKTPEFNQVNLESNGFIKQFMSQAAFYLATRRAF